MEDEDVISDFHAIGEKHIRADEHADIIVIGAGPAGLAAAIAAAKDGAQVMLVDENPVGAGLVGMDVPLLFGNRWTAALQNQGRMLEQVLAANPGLEEAFELGIDVRLGTYAWGAFTGGPNLRSLPEPVVGLADETRSWIVGFKRLIIATGARDLVYSFKGFETPGVVGALGLTALIKTYAAFNGQRITILGTGDLAVATATLALDAGYDVAALVEVRDAPQSDVSALVARGVEIVTGHAILEAAGTAEGVTAALLAPIAGGETRSIACDTICLAIGAVPVIDLADVAGAKIIRNAAGAFVPGTLPAGVSVIGDAAGLSADQLPADTDAYRMDWMRALMTTGGQDVIACTCEEVSRRDLLDVQPPRYLAAPTDKHNSLTSLAEDGPVNQDQMKRLTRACMGPCQARRCREQVAMIMAIGTDRPLSSIALAGYRAPVRPLPLGVLAAASETPGMVEGWNVWFGIRTQWIPYDDIGTERETERAGRMAHF